MLLWGRSDFTAISQVRSFHNTFHRSDTKHWVDSTPSPLHKYYESLRKHQKDRQTNKPTFCGDLDTGPGDWDLIFFAGEPVKKKMHNHSSLFDKYLRPLTSAISHSHLGRKEAYCSTLEVPAKWLAHLPAVIFQENKLHLKQPLPTFYDRRTVLRLWSIN